MKSFLEAISPTAAALLALPASAFSGGVSVKAITKERKHGRHVVHSSTAAGRPVCGGGNAGRTAVWQEVIIDPDCKRCLAILNKRKAQNETNIQTTPA